MQEDEETKPMEEQEEQVQEQGQSMEEEDEPHLDMERGQPHQEPRVRAHAIV
jgi:hypothetical protein